MTARTRTRVGGLITVLLGIIGVVVSLLHWAPCTGSTHPLRPDGFYDNETLSAACATAVESADSNVLVLVLWTAAFITVMVTAAHQRRPWITVLALVPLVLLFPITDPGFFWQPWDAADTVPGRGVLASVAIIAAGVIVWLSASAAAALPQSTPEPQRV